MQSEADARAVRQLRLDADRVGLPGGRLAPLSYRCRFSWGPGVTYSCALSLVRHDEQLTPKQVRDWLSVHEEIVHSTIKIHRCAGT